MRPTALDRALMTSKACPCEAHTAALAEAMKVFIATSDTNYGVGVHGVFSSPEAAQSAIPGEWRHDEVNGWTVESESHWPVRLVETELDAVPGDTWLIHDGR